MVRHNRFCRRFVLSALVGILMVAVPAAAGEPFDYFRNSWSVIGLKDYDHGTRITPENRLLLSDGREAEIRFGRNLVPLGRVHVKTLVDGWMPIVVIGAADDPVRYEIKLWATPLPNVSDPEAAFDWPVEGENYLNFITARATNTGTEPAEAAFEVRLGGTKEDEKDAAGSFHWELPPGGSADATVRIPFSSVADKATYADADAALWLERTIAYWRGLLVAPASGYPAGAARIEVPCRKASEALLASHVCQLIANDHGELHGGEGFYDQFYIRDGGYQIMELEEAGLWAAAEKAIDRYLACQRPDGRFETQKNQFDANGQALWVLWQYFKITGDRAWLEKAYPQMRRAVDWMIEARRTEPADSRFAGLLPVAPADGEFLWDGKHHIVGYDLWNLRGLICTFDAAATLGLDADVRQLCVEAQRYRKAIDEACRKTGVAHFPPSWELEGTHWGNTETLWPTLLFPRDDPRVVATIDHARHVHGGGFKEGTIQWLGRSPAIHPYMSAYTTMASLRRGEDAQVVEDFYWYLLHSTATHAFPEGIFPARRFAWSNTIPHVTGASNYALMLRHMLIDERGDELHLLAAVPDWWLADGKEITVLGAPTHFGQVNLTVCGAAEGVHVELDPPERQRPRRIVLYLPESRPLAEKKLVGVEVVFRQDQATRWDFPTVVERYRQLPGAAAKEIAGLISLPLASPARAEQCTLLNLRAVANTDPFTAPFGVPNPGKFLFTGLKVGEQVVGGVPFQIINPDENEGRSFVVLHSPRAPANRPWPKEIRIPVHRQGRRIFFLGNVHGWDSQDPGTGPWGAVAEYVIRYADGQAQSVPLVTGRTIDEWAARPEADEVLAGLRGDPWHLNVLGVELRDAPIEEIVFRDLGTRAAPVLAAVTLEQ